MEEATEISVGGVMALNWANLLLMNGFDVK
jgi:hypothetical protein